MDRFRFRRPGGGALAVALFAALVISAVPARAAGSAPPPTGSWSLPVAGTLARGFEQPSSRYGAGHRGVDFALPPDSPVRAAGEGVVTFAGIVAGTLHVVVAHAGDLRTSYSYLATATVRRGDAVARGDLVGTTGGPTGDHRPGFHFGLRLGDEYVDPMLLFRPPDLSRIVHLSPVTHQPAPTGGSWAVEALGVWRGLDIRAHPAPNEPTGGALGSIGSWLAGAADAGTTIARALPGGADVEAAAERLVAVGRARLDCTASPPDADGSGGSGHQLMAVGGIDSSTDPETGATFGLPPAALGYDADEIHWYSYAADGGAYVAADTHGRIHLAAVQLADQLRALQRSAPGREVDLVAHSQGGVVVDEFLQHVYDAADPTFPPIGTVVTLSSPHQGAPLATAADQIATTDAGAAALGAASDAGLPAGASALQDLRENSRTIRELWRHRLPDQVDFTTIGAVDDIVVPASRTSVPGAAEVVVDPRGPLDHSGVTNDREALAAVRLALEGGPPPCPSIATAVRGALEPLVITRIEHVSGLAGRAAGAVVDTAAGLLP